MGNSTAADAEGGASRSGGATDSGAALVVLLNFGGPRDSGEVEEFLFEILRDPNTMQLPVPRWLQDRLARFIARRQPLVSRNKHLVPSMAESRFTTKARRHKEVFEILCVFVPLW